jgi:outer membrane protein insertion porin family
MGGGNHGCAIRDFGLVGHKNRHYFFKERTKMKRGERLRTSGFRLALAFGFLFCCSKSALAGENEPSQGYKIPDFDDLVETTEGEPEAKEVVQWIEAPSAPIMDALWVSVAPELVTMEESREQTQGLRYAIEKIVIKGNKKTLRQVILQDVEIKPGEIFSVMDPRLERSRYRLLASGLFRKVEISLKRGSKRGWAILLIRVRERNTIVLQNIVFGHSEITPYFSLDVAERSLLGSGIKVSAAVVKSREQWGYRLRFSDSHFLNSDFALNVEGLFNSARDFFGNRLICFERDCEDPPESVQQFAVMKYRRAGMHLGTGYAVLVDNLFTIDYRFEMIDADVPPYGSHDSYGMTQPIEYGHLLPGQSRLSSIVIGMVRDTRDNFILPSEGHRTAFAIELSNEIIGSSYNFSKFTLGHDTYLPLGKGHAIRLGGFLGLIMGDSPFFNQFFVGDFSSFVSSRVLDLNFSHLQSNLLETTIREMRYEDMAFRISLEYSAPFYRGQKFLYGIDGFVSGGVFFLASRADLQTDPKGYQDHKVVPMDITMDLGIRIDTQVGLFIISLSNVLRLIPHVNDGVAKE